MGISCPLKWDKFSIAFPETAFPQFTRKELIENLNSPPNEAAQMCPMELCCPFPGSASLKQEALCAGGTNDYCDAELITQHCKTINYFLPSLWSNKYIFFYSHQKFKSPPFKADVCFKIEIGCQLMIIQFFVVQDKNNAFHKIFVVLFSFLNAHTVLQMKYKNI